MSQPRWRFAHQIHLRSPTSQCEVNEMCPYRPKADQPSFSTHSKQVPVIAMTWCPTQQHCGAKFATFARHRMFIPSCGGRLGSARLRRRCTESAVIGRNAHEEKLQIHFPTRAFVIHYCNTHRTNMQRSKMIEKVPSAYERASQLALMRGRVVVRNSTHHVDAAFAANPYRRCLFDAKRDDLRQNFWRSHPRATPFQCFGVLPSKFCCFVLYRGSFAAADWEQGKQARKPVSKQGRKPANVMKEA